MTQEEAIELVKNAIEAGIFNDLGIIFFLNLWNG